jgi:tetratricopeptide (TPR) repeat protein
MAVYAATCFAVVGSACTVLANDTSDTFIEKGWALTESGQYQQAVEAATEAIRADPKCGAAYDLRARAHLALRADTRAVADFDLAIQHGETSADLYVCLAAAHLHGNKFDLALDAIRKAQAIDPENAAAYATECAVHMQARNFKAALASIDEAIRREPNNPLALTNRALVHIELENFDAAIADASKAIFVDAEHSAAYLNRSLAYARMRLWTQAIDDATEAIRLSPTCPSGYNNRAFAYGERGDYAEMIQDASKVIALDPADLSAYGMRARGYRELHDWRGAIGDYTRMIDLAPDAAAGYALRGDVEMRSGNLLRARKDCDAAINLDARCWWAHYTLGEVDLAEGRFEDAVQHFSKALDGCPTERINGRPRALIYYSRATAHLRGGCKDAAESDFANAGRHCFDGEQVSIHEVVRRLSDPLVRSGKRGKGLAH